MIQNLFKNFIFLFFIFSLAEPVLSENNPVLAKYSKEIKEIKSILINKYLTDLFNQIDILLVDFKIEFGRFYSNGKTEIILADEISPDSCRLWDIKSNEKLDKDRFRRNLGGLIEAYKEVATRLQIDLSNF